jgi:prefoldin subunit 5
LTCSELAQCEEEMARLREQLQLMDKEVTMLRAERASINTMLDTELTRR